MGTTIASVGPVMADVWVKQQDQGTQQPSAVPPVQQAEKSSNQTVGQENKKSGADSSSNSKGSTPDAAQVKQLATQLQDYLAQLNVSLKFNVDDKTHQLIVQVLNPVTGALIRQLPPEDAVKLQEKLVEMRGVLYDGKM